MELLRWFLNAPTHLYMRLYPSICLSVTLSLKLQKKRWICRESWLSSCKVHKSRVLISQSITLSVNHLLNHSIHSYTSQAHCWPMSPHEPSYGEFSSFLACPRNMPKGPIIRLWGQLMENTSIIPFLWLKGSFVPNFIQFGQVIWPEPFVASKIGVAFHNVRERVQFFSI